MQVDMSKMEIPEKIKRELISKYSVMRKIEARFWLETLEKICEEVDMLKKSIEVKNEQLRLNAEELEELRKQKKIDDIRNAINMLVESGFKIELRFYK